MSPSLTLRTLASALVVAGLGLIHADSASAADAKDARKAAKSQNAQAKKALAKKARAAKERPLVPAAATVSIPDRVDSLKVVKQPGRPLLPLGPSQVGAHSLTAPALDELVESEAAKAGIPLAERISDDQFVRRAFLDVIGELPSPADINDYLADTTPDRKAKLIERLLAMPQFGKNWGRYWRDVVVYRSAVADRRMSGMGEVEWFADRLNANVPWDKIVTQIVTAKGPTTESPQAFFFAAHEGKPEEIIGEMSRIFMGVQIACAQCHDHKTDPWKRDQFHEMASFFGKSAIRRRRDLAMQAGVPFVIEVVAARPDREYKKPDEKDPAKPGEVVPPVFLSGQSIPLEATDAQRRQTFAGLLTSKRNTYFAKAFVNRTWSELTGRGFVNPIDDLGPDRPTTMPRTFAALTRSFAATDYDVKELFRVILNSRAYDRRFAEPKGSESDAWAISPARLTSDQLLDAIDWVVGMVDDNRETGNRNRPGVRGLFRAAFGYDPSSDQQDVESSIPQALALMNNPNLSERINATTEGSLLSKILSTQSSDDKAIELLYLRALARKPTSKERETCLAYIAEVGKRNEAYEDILWSLLNSTEFLFNH